MFAQSKKIIVKEPATGEAYTGVAKPDETLVLPGVSSCLVIVFKLENGMVVGGHAPMIWGKDDEFDLLVNAERVMNEMLNLSKANITKIVFVGDKSMWNHQGSFYGPKIAEILLKEKNLKHIYYEFFDKENSSNVDVIVAKDIVNINDTKTNINLTIRLDITGLGFNRLEL